MFGHRVVLLFACGCWTGVAAENAGTSCPPGVSCDSAGDLENLIQINQHHSEESVEQSDVDGPRRGGGRRGGGRRGGGRRGGGSGGSSCEGDLDAWDIADMKFNLDTLVTNNLDGLGPKEKEPEEMRWEVLDVDGTKIDLLVTALSPMTEGKNYRKATGVVYYAPDFATINIQSNTNLKLKYQFVKRGTYKKIKVHKVWFTLFDMDGDIDEPDFVEKITVTGFAKEVRTPNTQVRRYDNEDGTTTFMSSEPDASGGKTNPESPLKLTQSQKNKAVTLMFDGVSEFVVDFKAVGGVATKPRSYFWAGKCAINFDEDECPQPEPTPEPTPMPTPRCMSGMDDWDMADLLFAPEKLVMNNLDGLGPDDGAEEVRYHKAVDVVVKGIELQVDLVVTALTPYTPGLNYASGEGTGVFGKFGIINVKSQKPVTVQFTFYEPGTTTAVEVEDLWFSLFDFDGDKDEPAFTESITLTNIAEYIVDPESEVDVTESGNSVTFTSTEPDNSGGKTNPTDPLALTGFQKRRSVTVKFDKVSSFTAELKPIGGETNKPRSFMFAGKCNLNFDDEGCPILR